MSSYLKQHGTRVTPQSEPMRSDQVENSAGGFVWTVDKWTRLRRFLILGSEGGSYYATEKQLTKGNVDCVRECIAEDGLRTVKEIVEVSRGGKAPQNDPALFALASAISLGDNVTKSAAAEALPAVARIGTHLYHFVAYAETMRGWGRTMRWAVANWYDTNPEQLALQAVKYRQRDGWSHRDLLRLAHPATATPDLAAIYNWIVGKPSEFATTEDSPLRLIEGFELAQKSDSSEESARLVREYKLPRETILTEHLNDKVVWEALLETDMPMHALTRNLATMTRNGILDSTEHRKLVLESLSSEEKIRKSRLHPMALLIAMSTYASGKGFRGTNTWMPIPDITDALDAAFYLAFDNVVPTGKSHLLALDVSPSMASGGYYGQGGVAGSPLTPREASVAMALITLHAEPLVEVVAFASRLEPLGLSRRQRLDDAVRMVTDISWARTDCAQPMLYATQHNKKYEAFIVYTDSETWSGSIHPKQALDTYRQRSGINAKSVVVGMVANEFTIADPQDAGMMDVVGFDTSAPAMMSEFVAGRL